MATTEGRDRLAARLWPSPLVDAALALGGFVVVLTLLAHSGFDAVRPGSPAVEARVGFDDLALTSVALAAVTTLPLVAWRRFPLGVFVITATAAVLLVGFDDQFDVALGPGVALYLLAANPRTRWTARTTILAVGMLAAYLAFSAAVQHRFPGPELLHNGLIWATAWFAGERKRLTRLHIADLTERARRADHDAERDRQLAAAEERTRIARDLHDSAGHAINVIAVRAGAARLRHHQDPERSLAALEAIETLARQTAEDIDHIVGTLRDDSSPGGTVDAPPGLASLRTLIDRHTEAGLEVTVGAAGASSTPGTPADQAAYRILQEALTNAARHGAGDAHVEVAVDESAIDLTVTNTVLPDAPQHVRGGHGLVGMRERATLLGGSLYAERSNGTFHLQAHIPYGTRTT